MNVNKIHLRIVDVYCPDPQNEDLPGSYWSANENRRVGFKKALKKLIRDSFPTSKLTFSKKVHACQKEIILALYDSSFPLDADAIEKLFEEKTGIRRVSTSPKDELRDYFPSPMILIGDNPLTCKNSGASLTSLDDRYSFFDSSIWHRYVFEEKDRKKFEENLLTSFGELLEHHKKNIYFTSVATEYLEFQSRKFLNSYFAGAHQASVKPFLFHSETEFKQEASYTYDQISPYKWGAYLIDDYGNQKLRTNPRIVEYLKTKDLNTKKNRKKFKSLTKAEVVLDLMEEGLIEVKVHALNEEKHEPIIKNVKAQLLKHKNIDFLLLDFLLKKETGEFGTDILKTICQDNQLCVSGAFDKHWVLSISSFGDAFHSKLRTMHLPEFMEHIYFYDGADPINTPNLFRAKLYTLLEAQKKSLDLRVTDIDQHIYFRFDSKKVQKFPELRPRLYSTLVKRNLLKLNLKLSNRVNARKSSSLIKDGIGGIDYSFFSSSYELVSQGSDIKKEIYQAKFNFAVKLRELLKLTDYIYENPEVYLEEQLDGKLKRIYSLLKVQHENLISLAKDTDDYSEETEKSIKSIKTSLDALRRWINYCVESQTKKSILSLG